MLQENSFVNGSIFQGFLYVKSRSLDAIRMPFTKRITTVFPVYNAKRAVSEHNAHCNKFCEN